MSEAGPDIEAYKRFVSQNAPEALTVIDGGISGKGDDYIILNYDGYRNASPDQAAKLSSQFNAASEGRSYQDIYNDPDISLNDHVKFVREGGTMLGTSGGAYVSEAQRILVMDSKVIDFRSHAREILGFDLPENSNDQKLFKEFARNHEAAHMMLGLGEAGADYAASVQLLKEHPGADTEKFLQNLADFRMLMPYRTSDSNAGRVALDYGHGCSVAINSAIHSDKSGLSVEDIHDHAQTYDAMNSHSIRVPVEGYKGPVRPEIAVRKALLAENGDISANQYQPGSIARAADKILKSGQFETGSVQNDILEELLDASRRVDASIGKMPSAPAPAPAAAPSMSAAMS